MTSTPGDAASDVYTHGHHTSVVSQHARRTAERDAAYLLPMLRAGMRLLDVGCGPGTITTGLARAVAPGEVVGLDVVPGVLDEARAHLASTDLANVRFQEGSVYALPFADASFDVVHMHQVMQHLARPADAAREAFRVLRPGGLLAVRDADYATMIHWPRTPGIERWLELYHAVAHRNGADPDMGRWLHAAVIEGGLDVVASSATPMLFTAREDVLNWGDSWSERVVASAFASQAVEYGLATRAELEAISADWRAWGRTPSPLFLYVNFECVGMKPAV